MADNPNYVRFSRVDDVASYVEAVGEEHIVDRRPYVRAVVPKAAWNRIIGQAEGGAVRVGPAGEAMGAEHDVIEIQDPPADPAEQTIENEAAIVVRTCRRA